MKKFLKILLFLLALQLTILFFVNLGLNFILNQDVKFVDVFKNDPCLFGVNLFICIFVSYMTSRDV